jgi:hypothetical protein
VTAPATQAAPAAASKAQQGKAVAVRPFKVGVQDIDDDPYDITVTLNTGTQTLTPQYAIPSTGFLRAVYMLVENTVTSSTATATGTAGVGVGKEDFPWNVIDTITFTDTNSSEIIGPITGYDLYVISKWGGYCFMDDPEANTDLFTSTTNATASSSASGSFSFLLRIPIEIVARDALGVLPNKSNSTPFKIKIQVAAISAIYVTSTTVGGSCRFRMFPDSYWEPTQTDGSGNSIANQPPGVNTTQYWNKTDYQSINPGTFQIMLDNSVGFPVRNLGFLCRDSTPTRSQGESDFPDDFQLQLQSNLMLKRPKKYWKRKITESFNYTKAGDAAGQKDNGLYWKPYNADFYGKPGYESRRSYLRTTDGMRLQIKGTMGGSGAHTLTVYTNYLGIGAGSSLAAITT